MRHAAIKKLAVRIFGHIAPSTLRFIAHHNPINRGRWPVLSALREDPVCREWLAALENPTRTRRGFRIYTVPGDLTSDWIKLHGQHETGTERFILDHLKPNSTFLDVGANIGYFSLLAAIAGKAKVISFEPQGPIADLLLKSVAHNHVEDSVRVERMALSNVAATMKMTSCPGNTGHARLIEFDDQGGQPSPVAVVVLDDWLREHPAGQVSVCKIDTEGTELKVLEGMHQLLDRDCPAIVVEVVGEFLAEFAASGARIFELLARHGYSDVSTRYTFDGEFNRYFVKADDV